jgi:hypothetical protein
VEVNREKDEKFFHFLKQRKTEEMKKFFKNEELLI